MNNIINNTGESLHWGLSYLRWPRAVIAVCCVVAIAAVYYSTSFRFDASSDTLVVEGDPDLTNYERVVDVFGGDDFVFLTFQPNSQNAISTEALQTLQSIVADLEGVEGVKSVFSVLDAPLLKSPPVALADLTNGFPTLNSAETDLTLSKQELTTSPFFRELLITLDGSATAIKVDLHADENIQRISAAQRALRAQGEDSGPQWTALADEMRAAREAYLIHRETLISTIREIRDSYATQGVLFLGGVPMIAADMISYVKNDLSVFSVAVVLLMIIVLSVFFRQLRWVILPLITAAAGVGFTVGLLGFFEWQATVISSNFVSLLGITTISLNIHLIVHYRELLHTQQHLDAVAIVIRTMQDKFAPCFYTALTTIAAFSSLTLSGILPVEYFGWMMCIGIVISFVVTYTLFPAILLLMPKGHLSKSLGSSNHFIRALGELVRWRAGFILGIGIVMAAVAWFGISKVSLDNRFAEYFDTDTDIYQGMNYIDRNLGGTIPFDVVLQFPPYEEEELDEDDDFFVEEVDPYPERYWYSRDMLDRLEAMQRFLTNQPQVGKVISLTLLEDFAADFNDNKKLTSVEIVAILGVVPDELHRQVIAPYASPRTGELRLAGRIKESAQSFDREVFRQQIQQFAVSEVGFGESEVMVTGMMVLFNSMLAQLLESQVNTLSYVLLAVFIMFLVLLRSLPYALLGMIPNTLASATVIAAMGYSGIPLDMMTTTIAAVCIGIGVDDTVHYLHRFREEYARWGDARVAVSFCHESIGRALFYTSITVMVGFSVLCFSNFIPTVMFGLWTAIAMGLALITNLTLLPAMLVLTHASRVVDPVLRGDAQG